MAASSPITGRFDPLLAEQSSYGGDWSKLRLFNNRWDDADTLASILVAVVVGLTIWWAVGRFRTSQRRQDFYSPHKLFNDICKLHQLSRHEMALLHTMANDRGVEATAVLFVHPEYFTPTANRHGDDDYCRALEALRQKLFGADFELEPTTATDYAL